MEFTVGQVGIGTLLRRTDERGPDSSDWAFDALQGHRMVVTRVSGTDVVVEITSKPHSAGYEPGKGLAIPKAYLTGEYFEILDPRTKEVLDPEVLR